MFQPFNRLGQEARPEEGTGIGLVVAKRLIELMNGVIGVESTVGVGSKFWIELKRAKPPEIVAPSSEAAAPIAAPRQDGTTIRTLLYVEDNPANLQLVERLIMRRTDLKLLTAVTGQLGVELARTAQPEVILLDINLPDINGIEALKILRQVAATASIPVIAVSANAMPRDVERGMKEGFFRYLTKPIKLEEFTDALNAALEYAKAERFRGGEQGHEA